MSLYGREVENLESIIDEHRDRISELETRLEAAVQRELALFHQANADASRIAELERCLKTALEFVPKSVAKRLDPVKDHYRQGERQEFQK